MKNLSVYLHYIKKSKLYNEGFLTTTIIISCILLLPLSYNLAYHLQAYPTLYYNSSVTNNYTLFVCTDGTPIKCTFAGLPAAIELLTIFLIIINTTHLYFRDKIFRFFTILLILNACCVLMWYSLKIGYITLFYTGLSHPDCKYIESINSYKGGCFSGILILLLIYVIVAPIVVITYDYYKPHFNDFKEKIKQAELEIIKVEQ